MSLDIFVFFFFSSRRRHTRCSRDWSSDVCSSDLKLFVFGALQGRWRGQALPSLASADPLTLARLGVSPDSASRFLALAAASARRSEEHTSELQSRLHLVCRLLLEKKKKNTK